MPQDIHDPAYVAGVFDRCASSYRKWSSVASFGFVARWRRKCVAALPGTGEPQTVVDLMAGTGEIWSDVLRRFPNTEKIVAIDISHQMHLHAMDRLHQNKMGQIEHVEDDFLDNSLPSNSAQLIVSSFGLKTLSLDQQRVFAKELARILKPGGHFSLVEATDPTGWRLRPLYRFYLDNVLPQIEKLFLKGAQDFSMLGVYTKTFKSADDIGGFLREQGLEVTVEKLFFGCAGRVSGKRPHIQ
jgi:demethylmenaquinone methyltransferase/2-methoxy-6-polyprenyl-1,4-benzoquinol methylase